MMTNERQRYIPGTQTNPQPYKTDFDWSRECDYISNVTDKLLRTPRGAAHPEMKSFNHDSGCFLRYCEMQRDSATRDGKHDAAQYIEHCIDDIKAHGGEEG